MIHVCILSRLPFYSSHIIRLVRILDQHLPTRELVGTAELPPAVEHFALRAPAEAHLALAVARQVADHLGGSLPGDAPGGAEAYLNWGR